MFEAAIGPLISAGTNIISGLLGRDAQQNANAVNQANAAANRNMQLDFAQKGIRWRVKDAEAAGIHPLYALGAQTSSFSPVSVGAVPETGLASGLAAAGQDISRAVNATRTQPERDAAVLKTVQDLELTNMGLKNELLASQIAKLKSSITPAMPELSTNAGPVPEANKFEDRPKLIFGGTPIKTAPDTANAEDFEKRYGDDGPVSWLSQAAIAARDFHYNMAGTKLFDILKWIDRKTAIDPNFLKHWR